MIFTHLNDKLKNPKDSELREIDSFKALIKCYTANAAKEDMKTVVRKQQFNYLSNYMFLLLRGNRLHGKKLEYKTLHKPVYRGINAHKDRTEHATCLDNYQPGVVGTWA